MPRRDEPDPLAKAIGNRIRTLRKAANRTLEKLAYESDVGSKGYLSDIEKGLAVPSLSTLEKLAHSLEVELLDLVTLPEQGPRHQLVDATRTMSAAAVRRLLADARDQRRGP